MIQRILWKCQNTVGICQIKKPILFKPISICCSKMMDPVSCSHQSKCLISRINLADWKFTLNLHQFWSNTTIFAQILRRIHGFYAQKSLKINDFGFFIILEGLSGSFFKIDWGKSQSQSSTFWHIQEKQGFHFLMGKLRVLSGWLGPPMKLIE